MDNPLILLARPLGLEPRTFGFVVHEIEFTPIYPLFPYFYNLLY